LNTVILLAKVPRPGLVKTRMIPFLSVLEASLLAESFLVDMLDILQELTDCDIRWAVPPGEPREDVLRLLPRGVALADQGAGDLGERLSRLAAVAFGDGARTVTLVGSDHPSLPPPLLARCLAEAADDRVGWIPTLDGGFAAMSLPRTLPELFEAVPWSTPRVADVVRDNARRAGIEVTAVGSWYDVDTVGDLLRLAADLATGSGCRATRRFLAALDPPLSARVASAPGRSTDA